MGSVEADPASAARDDGERTDSGDVRGEHVGHGAGSGGVGRGRHGLGPLVWRTVAPLSFSTSTNLVAISQQCNPSCQKKTTNNSTRRRRSAAPSRVRARSRATLRQVARQVAPFRPYRRPCASPPSPSAAPGIALPAGEGHTRERPTRVDGRSPPSIARQGADQRRPSLARRMARGRARAHARADARTLTRRPAPTHPGRHERAPARTHTPACLRFRGRKKGPPRVVIFLLVQQNQSGDSRSYRNKIPHIDECAGRSWKNYVVCRYFPTIRLARRRELADIPAIPPAKGAGERAGLIASSQTIGPAAVGCWFRPNGQRVAVQSGGVSSKSAPGPGLEGENTDRRGWLPNRVPRTRSRDPARVAIPGAAWSGEAPVSKFRPIGHSPRSWPPGGAWDRRGGTRSAPLGSGFPLGDGMRCGGASCQPSGACSRNGPDELGIAPYKFDDPTDEAEAREVEAVVYQAGVGSERSRSSEQFDKRRGRTRSCEADRLTARPGLDPFVEVALLAGIESGLVDGMPSRAVPKGGLGRRQDGECRCDETTPSAGGRSFSQPPRSASISPGGVAQLGERTLCKRDVAGSNPVSSTIFDERPFRKGQPMANGDGRRIGAVRSPCRQHGNAGVASACG